VIKKRKRRRTKGASKEEQEQQQQQQPPQQPQQLRFEILEVDAITPNKNQPRKEFVDETMQELVESIKANGVLQPVKVRWLPKGKYMLVDGERCWRACKYILKLKDIPA
jgi:ParB family chromosome partitioning protein